MIEAGQDELTPDDSSGDKINMNDSSQKKHDNFISMS